MGDTEQRRGLCHVCFEQNDLVKTYFHYPIACECCGPTHFSIVYHCATCIPKAPRVTELQVTSAKLLDPIHEGLFKKVRDE